MNLLNHLYQTEARKPRADNGLHFAPSYLTSCGRQLFWKKIGLPASDEMKPGADLKMAIGTAIHELVQRRLLSAYPGSNVELEIKSTIGGMQFVGYCDMVILPDIIPVEIKSVYGLGWKDVAEKPKDDHALQLHYYITVLKAKRGIILYIDRSNALARQHEITVDQYDMLFSQHISRLRPVWDKLTAGDKTPPAPDFAPCEKKPAWQCRYCQYFSACKKMEVENGKI